MPNNDQPPKSAALLPLNEGERLVKLLFTPNYVLVDSAHGLGSLVHHSPCLPPLAQRTPSPSCVHSERLPYTLTETMQAMHRLDVMEGCARIGHLVANEGKVVVDIVFHIPGRDLHCMQGILSKWQAFQIVMIGYVHDLHCTTIDVCLNAYCDP